MDVTSRLHKAIAAICPIDGVAILDESKQKIRVDFKASATDEQRAAAQGVIDTFDWSDAAQKEFEVQAQIHPLVDDLVLQYVLKQIQVACPDYEIPTKESISTALTDARPGQ